MQLVTIGSLWEIFILKPHVTETDFLIIEKRIKHKRQKFSQTLS